MIDHVGASSSLGRRLMAQLLAVLLLAGVTVADYLIWLGWDQHKDVGPDGSETGPYQAWQVVGLVLVLAVVGIGAAWRGYGLAVMFGVTGGLTAAVCVDWSDDESGLWVVGAIMVFIGTFIVTTTVAAVAELIRSRSRRRLGRGGRGRSSGSGQGMTGGPVQDS
jgi:hypothetical protein